MGIKNGAPTIVNALRHGSYNRQMKRYKINVDGEVIRYKGMVEANLTQHNAEEKIAITSFDYMQRVLKHIYLMIGSLPEEILIYMDGTRVSNKETTRADFRFNANIIRSIFKSMCIEHGFTINELQYGESELQMYLMRDKTVNLNVFLTSDSDMISICYGHRPKTATNLFTDKNDDRNKNFEHIADANTIYENGNEIYDSCLWVNCNRTISAISFDFVEDTFGYTPYAFRIFIALCGTDFTNSLLTESMMRGVLSANTIDIEYINSLTDINQIAACFQMLGIRGGGTIKRSSNSSIKSPAKQSITYTTISPGCIMESRKINTNQFDKNIIEKAIQMYVDYVTTGNMSEERIPRPDMSDVCRQYLYAMKGQNSVFVKKTLQTWALNTPLQTAVAALDQYLGTFDGNESTTIAPLSPKKTPTKRKNTNAMSTKHDKRKNNDNESSDTTTDCNIPTNDDALNVKKKLNCEKFLNNNDSDSDDDLKKSIECENKSKFVNCLYINTMKRAAHQLKIELIKASCFFEYYEELLSASNCEDDDIETDISDDDDESTKVTSSSHNNTVPNDDDDDNDDDYNADNDANDNDKYIYTNIPIDDECSIPPIQQLNNFVNDLANNLYK